MINARFAKPLDRQLILDEARGKRLVVTLEESVVDRRLRLRRSSRCSRRRGWPIRPTATSPLRIIGIPADRFVDHGVRDGPAARSSGSTRPGIAGQVREALAVLREARAVTRRAGSVPADAAGAPGVTGARRSHGPSGTGQRAWAALEWPTWADADRWSRSWRWSACWQIGGCGEAPGASDGPTPTPWMPYQPSFGAPVYPGAEYLPIEGREAGEYSRT